MVYTHIHTHIHTYVYNQDIFDWIDIITHRSGPQTQSERRFNEINYKKGRNYPRQSKPHTHTHTHTQAIYLCREAGLFFLVSPEDKTNKQTKRKKETRRRVSQRKLFSCSTCREQKDKKKKRKKKQEGVGCVDAALLAQRCYWPAVPGWPVFSLAVFLAREIFVLFSRDLASNE